MKRIRRSALSLLMVLSLCLSLCLPAIAAGGPPYSQPYLQGVSGLTYQAVLEISPTEMGLDAELAANTSQVTMEAYTIDNSLSWNEAALAAQRALENNGFQRDTENTGNLWMDKYLADGFESFIIADMEMTQAVFDTARFGNTLLLIHMRYTDPNAGQTEPPAQTPAGLSNFTRSVPYTPGQFSDVGSGAWYASAVQAACEYGLMSGVSDTSFSAEGNLTIAQTLVIACRLHDTYYGGGHSFAGTGGPWYQPYVDYAVANGICSTYVNYDANIDRGEFALVLTNALPAEALASINDIQEGAIPDVPAGTAYHDAVYRLYRAGILSGRDSAGTFAPADPITRAEVCVILSNMVDPSLRKTFTLTPTADPEPQPEPEPQPQPQSEFYADWPTVPDFGTYSGMPLSEEIHQVVGPYEQTYYRYGIEGMPDSIDSAFIVNYMNVLMNDYDFRYLRSYDQSGRDTSTAVFYKGSQIVEFFLADNSVVICCWDNPRV